MTKIEAEWQVEQCECDIQKAFEELCASAREMSAAAEGEAQKALSVSRLWGFVPLITGIIVCYAGGIPGIIAGIILIISGIARIVSGKSSRAIAFTKIQQERKTLERKTKGKKI